MQIDIPESNRCEVVGYSFRMHCNKCGLVWDVYVEVGKEITDLWDICRNCLTISQAHTNETSTKYDYRFTRVLAKYPYLNHG